MMKFLNCMTSFMIKILIIVVDTVAHFEKRFDLKQYIELKEDDIMQAVGKNFNTLIKPLIEPMTK